MDLRLTELIDRVLPHLSPGAADPRTILGPLSWTDRREIEVAIAHAWPDYCDQSWAHTVMEAWAFPGDPTPAN